MAHQKTYRELSVYQENINAWEGNLKKVFNEFGFWLVPINGKSRKNNIIAVFSEKELTEVTGKRGYKGWIGKKLDVESGSVVVFPTISDIFLSEDSTEQMERCVGLLNNVDTSDLSIRIVRTKLDVRELRDSIVGSDVLTVDFETSCLSPYDEGARLLTIAVLTKDGAWVMPLDHKDSPFKGDHALQNDLLKIIAKHPLIAHNAKFEIRWFMSRGIRDLIIEFDPMLADHLINENAKHDLDTLSIMYTPYGGYKSNFESKLEEKDDYESAPFEELCKYNALDVICTDLVAKELKVRLKGEGNTWILYFNLIRSIIPLIAEMEDNGFVIDEKELERLTKVYLDYVADCERKIQKNKTASAFFKDKEFNFNSYPQLRTFLYDFLKFPVIRRTEPTSKFPQGNPAVDSVALRIMYASKKHRDIIELLVQRAKAYTIYKSFLKPYAERVSESSDRKLRTNFNIHVVVTGRLSSSGPNLQNVPRNADLQAVGLQPIKSIFRSRFKDGVLVQADYGQLELRVATMYTVANGTPDQTFMAAFKDGRDMHGEMAKLVYGENFTKEERDKGKRTNFSAVFDISPKQLAENLDIDVDEAEELLANFKALHPDLYMMFNEWWDAAKKDGYIENFLGRRRHIQYLIDRAQSDYEVDDIRRQVWNFPIQSSAAEMTLTSTMLLRNWMRENKCESVIIGNVHDSVILDCTKKEVNKIMKQTHKIFTGLDRVYEWITVPLRVDIGYGPNLVELEEYKPS